jgi:hypothetical protein
VTIQTFIKVLSLIRIYPKYAFLIRAIAEVGSDLKEFIIFAFMVNGLFAILWRILMIGEKNSTELWGPIHWLFMSLRNAVTDF